jgi:hypothetical protein
MATTIRARIYARGEVSFAKLVCQTVGDQFFLFCQNYMDAKLVYQTVGVALSEHKGTHIFGRPIWFTASMYRTSDSNYTSIIQ